MKAYELLNTEDKWTKESYAKNASGGWCQAWEAEAVKWCAAGAIQKCYDGLELSSQIMSILFKNLGKNIAFWNDSSTYDQVIAKLKALDI